MTHHKYTFTHFQLLQQCNSFEWCDFLEGYFELTCVVHTNIMVCDSTFLHRKVNIVHFGRITFNVTCFSRMQRLAKTLKPTCFVLYWSLLCYHNSSYLSLHGQGASEDALCHLKLGHWTPSAIACHEYVIAFGIWAMWKQGPTKGSLSGTLSHSWMVSAMLQGTLSLRLAL